MNAIAPPCRAGVAALLLVLALGAAWNGQGAFFRPSTHLVLWDSISIVGIAAIGQCLVVLSGGIDLSVGAVLALGGTTFAGLQLGLGWHWLPAALATLGVGGVVGSVNGWLVAHARLQPFLVTLAAMVTARGLARWLPELAGKPAGSKFMPDAATLPPFWSWLSGRLALGVPVTGLLWLALAAVAWTVVVRTVHGRHLLATGANETAARLAGVATRRTKAAAYVASGVLAVLAGICTVARDGSGDPGAGDQLELRTIAAVVVGGTSLLGGRGGIGRSVLGVLTIGYIERILSMNGTASHWQLVIQGVIVLLAVALQPRRD